MRRNQAAGNSSPNKRRFDGGSAYPNQSKDNYAQGGYQGLNYHPHVRVYQVHTGGSATHLYPNNQHPNNPQLIHYTPQQFQCCHFNELWTPVQQVLEYLEFKINHQFQANYPSLCKLNETILTNTDAFNIIKFMLINNVRFEQFYLSICCNLNGNMTPIPDALRQLEIWNDASQMILFGIPSCTLDGLTFSFSQAHQLIRFNRAAPYPNSSPPVMVEKVSYADQYDHVHQITFNQQEKHGYPNAVAIDPKAQEAGNIPANEETGGVSLPKLRRSDTGPMDQQDSEGINITSGNLHENSIAAFEIMPGSDVSSPEKNTIDQYPQVLRRQTSAERKLTLPKTRVVNNKPEEVDVCPMSGKEPWTFEPVKLTQQKPDTTHATEDTILGRDMHLTLRNLSNETNLEQIKQTLKKIIKTAEKDPDSFGSFGAVQFSNLRLCYDYTINKLGMRRKGLNDQKNKTQNNIKDPIQKKIGIQGKQGELYNIEANIKKIDWLIEEYKLEFQNCFNEVSKIVNHETYTLSDISLSLASIAATGATDVTKFTNNCQEYLLACMNKPNTNQQKQELSQVLNSVMQSFAKLDVELDPNFVQLSLTFFADAEKSLANLSTIIHSFAKLSIKPNEVFMTKLNKYIIDQSIQSLRNENLAKLIWGLSVMKLNCDDVCDFDNLEVGKLKLLKAEIPNRMNAKCASQKFNAIEESQILTANFILKKKCNQGFLNEPQEEQLSKKVIDAMEIKVSALQERATYAIANADQFAEDKVLSEYKIQELGNSVDIYIEKFNLAIQIDGPMHYKINGMLNHKTELNTKLLELAGIHVLRISYKDIDPIKDDVQLKNFLSSRITMKTSEIGVLLKDGLTKAVPANLKGSIGLPDCNKENDLKKKGDQTEPTKTSCNSKLSNQFANLVDSSNVDKKDYSDCEERGVPHAIESSTALLSQAAAWNPEIELTGDSGYESESEASV
ncbi:MAG: RAP domain-containing protein [Rickettsiaceae bacterium]|nr:RAP domain-containing protein [Rickettsiaceae bacterium]